MKTYSCYACDKEFKTSRSLASHNYKFHSSTQSTPRKHVQNFKDDASNISEDNSFTKTTLPDGATIVETLVELKALMRSLQQKVEFQEEKVEDLDNHLLQVCSTEIADIKNKLGKVVKAHREQSFEEKVNDILLMRTLLRARGTKTLGNRIQELKNAASAISEAFDLDWNDALLLKKISNAYFTEAKQIFEENIAAVKAIFSALPPEDELEKIIRGEESDKADIDEKILPTENNSDNEDASEDSQGEESEEFSESSSEEGEQY